MEVFWIASAAYGVSAALYGLRVCQKFFQVFEGTTRNGTIVTSGIAAGLVWPFTLILDGFRGVWQELAPIRIKPVETEALPYDPERLLSIPDALNLNVKENLNK